MLDMSIEKLDVKGKMCPMPVAFTKRKLASMASGQLLEVVGQGELECDNILSWVRNNGHEVIKTSISGSEFKIVIRNKIG